MDLLGFKENLQAKAEAMECGVVWLGFANGLNSYANEWEDHSNHWGTTHSSLLTVT